jgi:hypothetical protein
VQSIPHQYQTLRATVQKVAKPARIKRAQTQVQTRRREQITDHVASRDEHFAVAETRALLMAQTLVAKVATAVATAAATTGAMTQAVVVATRAETPNSERRHQRNG